MKIALRELEIALVHAPERKITRRDGRIPQ
jgi:hypothetical protein